VLDPAILCRGYLLVKPEDQLGAFKKKLKKATKAVANKVLGDDRCVPGYFTLRTEHVPALDLRQLDHPLRHSVFHRAHWLVAGWANAVSVRKRRTKWTAWTPRWTPRARAMPNSMNTSKSCLTSAPPGLPMVPPA
jgi:hypothetical protein